MTAHPTTSMLAVVKRGDMSPVYLLRRQRTSADPMQKATPRGRAAAMFTTATLAVTLLSFPAAAQPTGAPTFTAEQAERGQANYRRNCVDCHGTELNNGEFGGPALKGGFFLQKWA